MADLAHGSDDEYDSDIELDYFHRTCVVKHTFGSNEWENKSFQALCLNGAQIHKIITREIICKLTVCYCKFGYDERTPTARLIVHKN